MSAVLSLLILAVFAIVVIPVTLAGALVGVALYIVGQILTLPFRLAGHGGVSAGVILGSVKVFLLIAIGGLSVLALALGLFPLLVFLLILLGLWLILRPARRPPEPRSV